MSVFKVNVVACNPRREDQVTPRRKRPFPTATKQTIRRDVGHAILRANGYETTDEVVFAEPGDMN